jgi:hypothetical protein
MKFIFLFLFSMQVNLVNAQFKLETSIGLCFPKIHYKNHLLSNYSSGFCFSISANYFVKQRINLGINSGYLKFGGREGIDVRRNIIPLTLSGDILFLNGKLKPFVGLNTGVFFIEQKSHLPFANYSTTSFGLAPEAGLLIKLSEKLDLNLRVKYQWIFEKYFSMKFLNPTAGLLFSL